MAVFKALSRSLVMRDEQVRASCAITGIGKANPLGKRLRVRLLRLQVRP